jgi:putative MATE family efflux protein
VSTHVPTRAGRVRALVGLAVPAVGALIADPLMGLVDTAVAGRLGAAALGGLGLGVAALTTVSWVFNFLLLGTTSTVARALGAGDRPAAVARIGTAVRVALGAGVVVAVALLLLAPALVAALGAVEALRPTAVAYLRVRAVGLPFLLLTYVGYGAFRGLADTRTPLVVAVGANLVNAALTVALAGPLGLVGVAAATVVAEALGVAALGVLLARRGLLPRGAGAGAAAARELLVVGRDLFLRTGGLLLGFLAIAAAAARTGEVTAAAHQVLNQTLLLAAFTLDGLAVGAQVLIGAALGRGDAAEARALGRTAAGLGLVAGAVTAAVLLALGGVLPRLLTDDAAVLAAVATAWWLLAAGHLITGVVFTLDGVLMGAEDYAFLRTSTIVAAAVGGGLAQVLAARGTTLLALWWALTLMMAVRGILTVGRLAGGGWTADAVRPPGVARPGAAHAG